jgi:FMN phosphatase YigB (HAD superfamily)
MNPVLVLDIDGVLIRDKMLLNHVKQNCIKYVKAKMPEVKNATMLNKMLYETYGHTGKGLKSEYKIQTKDFNEFVYDKRLISHLWAFLQSSQFQSDAKQIHELTQSGWDVRLFSNSPLVWSIPVAGAISDEVQVVYNENMLKPDLEAYTQFDSKRRHIFVDDSLKNLLPAKWLLKWNTLYFCDQKTQVYPSVNSIEDLVMYLRYVPLP